MNTFLVIVVKIVTCNMVVEILFVGRYDVEGGLHNRGGSEVCFSDTCYQLMWLHSIVKFSSGAGKETMFFC